MSIRMVPQVVCDEPECGQRGVSTCDRCHDDICLGHECHGAIRQATALLCCSCVLALREWIQAGATDR